MPQVSNDSASRGGDFAGSYKSRCTRSRCYRGDGDAGLQACPRTASRSAGAARRVAEILESQTRARLQTAVPCFSLDLPTVEAPTPGRRSRRSQPLCLPLSLQQAKTKAINFTRIRYGRNDRS